MIDSQAASCPEIRSFRIWDTMPLPAIRRNISLTPIGQRPGLLSKGIKRHPKNVYNIGEWLSAVHSFLITSAVAEDFSGAVVELSCYQNSPPPISLQSWWSSSTSCFNCCLFLVSQHRLRPALLDVLVLMYLSKKFPSNSASLPCGYFYFNWFKVFLLNGRIPFCLLSVNSFITLVTFPLYISRVNFLEILESFVDGVFNGHKSFWIVSPSRSNSRISPDVHIYNKSIRCSNAC